MHLPFQEESIFRLYKVIGCTLEPWSVLRCLHLKQGRLWARLTRMTVCSVKKYWHFHLILLLFIYFYIKTMDLQSVITYLMERGQLDVTHPLFSLQGVCSCIKDTAQFQRNKLFQLNDEVTVQQHIHKQTHHRAGWNDEGNNKHIGDGLTKVNRNAESSEAVLRSLFSHSLWQKKFVCENQGDWNCWGLNNSRMLQTKLIKRECKWFMDGKWGIEEPFYLMGTAFFWHKQLASSLEQSCDLCNLH